MSTKHTPGPWLQSHRQGADRMYRTEVYSEEHGGIATCNWTPEHCGNGVTSTYREANARLIAAAPELLEMLQSYSLPIDTNNIALSCIEFGTAAVERELKRRAAIAKATGATP